MSQALVANKPGELQTYLTRFQGSIAAALPKHLTAERMIRLAMTAVSTNPQLQQCTLLSVLGAVVMAAQMGLEPGVLGQGYLVPYRDRRTNSTRCQFIPGWQGIVELIHRAGRATVRGGAVYVGDAFEWELGTNQHIRHRPCFEDDPAKLTHAYAIGTIQGLEDRIIECWDAAKIARHRDRYNKVGTQHYSFEHWEMYARKVVLLQVTKYLPKSIELARAVALEAAADEGRAVVQTADGFVIEGDEDVARPERPAPAPAAAKSAGPPKRASEAAQQNAQPQSAPPDQDAGKQPDTGAAAAPPQQRAISDPERVPTDAELAADKAKREAARR